MSIPLTNSNEYAHDSFIATKKQLYQMKNSLDKLIVDGKPGRTVGLNGSQFLFFSGYNYLGINKDEELL